MPLSTIDSRLRGNDIKASMYDVKNMSLQNFYNSFTTLTLAMINRVYVAGPISFGIFAGGMGPIPVVTGIGRGFTAASKGELYLNSGDNSAIRGVGLCFDKSKQT